MLRLPGRSSLVVARLEFAALRCRDKFSQVPVVNAVSQLATYSADELRALWIRGDERDTADERYLASEALWEYWRRVCSGEIPFSHDDLEATLATSLWGKCNGVGEAVKCGVVPEELLTTIIERLSRLDTDDSRWAMRQVRARKALLGLGTETDPARRVSLMSELLSKGTSWAALAAIDRLTEHELDQFVRMAMEARAFSRSALHDLRTAARKRARRS